MAKVILREKVGSFDRVERVFGFSPDEGMVVCLMRDYGGRSYLAAHRVEDLEAVHDDPAGTFADVRAVVRDRAEYTVPSLEGN